MNFKEAMKIAKEEYKSIAKRIRHLKSQRKQALYGFVPGLEDAQWEARHMHVAYSELRGRTRDQIESEPKTEICENTVTRYKNGWLAEVDHEALRNCA